MATYLLAWNPQRWQWGDLCEYVQRVAEEGSVVRRWSCGSSTQIKKGDRLFISAHLFLERLSARLLSYSSW
jgi:hypothetical protein